MTFHDDLIRDDLSRSDTFSNLGHYQDAFDDVCGWSSQRSGVLVNLYDLIIIIWRERREEIMHSCCLYCCV